MSSCICLIGDIAVYAFSPGITSYMGIYDQNLATGTRQCEAFQVKALRLPDLYVFVVLTCYPARNNLDRWPF